MNQYHPNEQLLIVKDKLGEINFINLDTSHLIITHKKLGEIVRQQTQAILSRKLERMNYELFAEQIKAVRRCQKAINSKITSSQTDSKIQKALIMYINCLDAWTIGVQLKNFIHKNMPDLIIDGEIVSTRDIALLLQNDNSGCQTGVLREQDGSALLWHTEEDVEEKTGSRFDKLRFLISQTRDGFRNQEMGSFIYPDLLPGPAFGWHGDSYLQAVDSLYLDSGKHNGEMLANVVVWVTLYLGGEIETEKIIKALGPYSDGYAIVSVTRNREQVHAQKIEFAGDQIFILTLDKDPGSYLFQANVFSDKESYIAKIYEDILPNERIFFEQRIQRTESAMIHIKEENKKIRLLFNLLSSTEGEEYAYSNEHVKAYFVCSISPISMKAWIGAGPALVDDEPITLLLKSKD